MKAEMHIGRQITCAKLTDLDTVPISTGKITQIPDFDHRGCRTQITTEVADARRMIDNWGGGLPDRTDMMTLPHRVVSYGNYRQSMGDLAVLMGWKVVEETRGRLSPPWPRRRAGLYNTWFEECPVGHFDPDSFVRG